MTYGWPTAARRTRLALASNGAALEPMIRASSCEAGGRPGAVPCTTTVPGPVCTGREDVTACTTDVSSNPPPITSTTSPGRMSGVTPVQQLAVPPLTAAAPEASVVAVAVLSRMPPRLSETVSGVLGAVGYVSSMPEESGRTAMMLVELTAAPAGVARAAAATIAPAAEMKARVRLRATCVLAR